MPGKRRQDAQDANVEPYLQARGREAPGTNLESLNFLPLKKDKSNAKGQMVARGGDGGWTLPDFPF